MRNADIIEENEIHEDIIKENIIKAQERQSKLDEKKKIIKRSVNSCKKLKEDEKRKKIAQDVRKISPNKEQKVDKSIGKKRDPLNCPVKIISELEFMHEKRGLSKRLTKVQEKGLIERLQGGISFKFQHK